MQEAQAANLPIRREVLIPSCTDYALPLGGGSPHRMDMVQWCVALSIGKDLLRSKMAPYILEDKPEQEQVWPPEHHRSFLDQVDSFDSSNTKPLYSIKPDSMGAGSAATAHHTPRAEDTMASSSSLAHASSRIAFGLELKCLVPLLSLDTADPEPFYTWDITKHDGKIDRIPVRPSVTPREIVNDVNEIHQYARRLVAQAISTVPGCRATTIEEIAQMNHQERDYWKTHWIVKKANSAFPTQEKKEKLRGYTWVPIEISSPKLHSDDEHGTYGSVESVMAALNSRLRLVTNYSCDIHVHVGRMDDAPFPLPTLKRLGMLLWMAEPILRTVRDPASENYTNIHTWGAEMRKYSRLAQLAYSASITGSNPSSTSAKKQADALVRELLDITSNQTNIRTKNLIDLEALRLIATSRDYEQLGRLLSGETAQYRRLGFNFSAFGKEDKRAHTNPRTVEFRIMESTTEIDVVLAWLRICKAVTSVAVDNTLLARARFTSLMLRLLREGEEYGLVDKCGKVATFKHKNEKAEQQFNRLMTHVGAPEDVCRAFKKKVYDPPPAN